MERNLKIFNKLELSKQYVEQQGYNVFGVFLYGSQNYNLDDENSDVDCIAITIPTFKEFTLNKSPVSITHITEEGEHIDIKDIRLVFQTMKKQSINLLEILFTDFFIINDKYNNYYSQLLEAKEAIAYYNPISCVKCAIGMTCRFNERIQNSEEMSPELNKQLSQVMRLFYFTQTYINGPSFKRSLIPFDLGFVKLIKQGKVYNNLEEIKKFSDYITHLTRALVNTPLNYIMFPQTNVEKLLDTISYNIIKQANNVFLYEQVFGEIEKA